MQYVVFKQSHITCITYQNATLSQMNHALLRIFFVMQVKKLAPGCGGGDNISLFRLCPCRWLVLRLTLTTPRGGFFEIPLTFGWGNPCWYQRDSRNLATNLGEWVPKNSKVEEIKLWNSDTSQREEWGSFSRTRNTLPSISQKWTSTEFRRVSKPKRKYAANRTKHEGTFFSSLCCCCLG